MRAFLVRVRCMENGKEVAWCEKPGEMSRWTGSAAPQQAVLGIWVDSRAQGPIQSFNQALSVLIFCLKAINFQVSRFFLCLSLALESKKGCEQKRWQLNKTRPTQRAQEICFATRSGVGVQ